MTTLSPYLRAKHSWYQGELRGAVAYLEEILGEGAVSIPDSDLGYRRSSPFESVLLGVLAHEDRLTLPFGLAAQRLWQAFPNPYVVIAWWMRGESADARWLQDGLADGLFSDDIEDRFGVAKVLLRSLPDEFDTSPMLAPIAHAQASGAWERYVHEHREVTANLFLDHVFYAARVMAPEIILDRLEGVDRRQFGMLDLVAETLSGWDPEEVAWIGMRVESASARCTERFIEVLRSRDFGALTAD
jgi:hypothetical protein